MLKKVSVPLLVLTIAAILFAFFYLQPKPGPVPPQSASVPAAVPVQAFMNTSWGMSVRQVMESMGADLVPTDQWTRFYSPRNHAAAARLKAYQQDGFTFLDRAATVTYVFFKDRLFLYQVRLRSSDPEALDAAVTDYLKEQFGEGFVQTGESDSAKIIWQKKDLIVNYWFYEDKMRLREPFFAGFGVVYQPLEGTIE